jgi:hypothetical protein
VPDLGDYITRLLCDASKYTQGTSAAVAGNRELSGSCNTIIGALERQKRALDTVGRSTLDWIEADKKASNEIKEHARALLVEVDALRQKQAALAAVATEQSRVIKHGTEIHSAGGRPRGGSGEYSFPAAEPARDTEVNSGSYTGGNDHYGSGANPQSHAEMMAEMARKRRMGAGGLNILSEADVAADQQEARRRAGADRDQQEADEAKARDEADRIRKERQRIRGDRDAEDDADKAAADAEHDRRNNAVRDLHGSIMDRREMTGSVGFSARGISGSERQRFLREQRDLEGRMDAQGITDPGERSLLTGGLKKSQQGDVSGRIEKERTGILIGLKQQVLAAKQAEDEYTLSKLKGDKASAGAIAKARKDADEHILKPLRDRGADANEIAAAQTLINKHRELGDVRKRRQKNEHENESKKDHRQWAGVEGFRAIEDFAQGSATGGLRGGLLAASNNISQMGAAFGAAGAMAGSVVSTVIVLGSSIYETWRKAAYGGNEANAAIKEYDRMVSSVLSHTRELGQLRITSRDMQSGSSLDGAVQNEQRLRDNATRREEDLKAKEEAFKDQMAGMGAQGLTSGDLNSEASRREETVWGLRRNAASEQHANLSEEALTLENRQRIMEQEREHLRGHQLLFRERQQLPQAEKLAMERGQAEADRNQAVERSRRVGGVGPLTEWQQMEKERGFANEENAKAKGKFERGQSWMQSRREDILLSGMASDKQRDAYRAEKEHQESLAKSAEAERLGIMTPKERKAMDDASTAKRDKDIRESKYGDLQADGNSGFGSADVKTSQGFNALVKAMRYSEQDKTIAELKKNGDITKESAQAIVDALNIKLSAPVPVVDFN